MLYKITGGIAPAVDPEEYLTGKREGRPVKTKWLWDKYNLERRVSHNSKVFNVQYAHTEQFKNSFFVKTIVDSNSPENETVNAQTVESIKTVLQLW